MIEILPIKAIDYLSQATDLMVSHWQENESELTDQGPNPYLPMYYAMEKADMMIMLGCFEGTVMVGYAIAFVYPHPHYGIVFAQHDVLFVRKDMRRGSLGLRLIHRVKEEAKARGARFICWHAKPGSAMDKILRTRSVLEELVYREEI